METSAVIVEMLESGRNLIEPPLEWKLWMRRTVFGLSLLI